MEHPAASLDIRRFDFFPVSIRLLIALTTISIAHGRNQFVPKEGDWRYYHDEQAPGASWNEPKFDDSAWTSGVGSFGYGKLQPRTNLRNTRPVTAYFRTTFQIEDPKSWERFEAELKMDDGVVVYLNGSEIFRSNMPTGAVEAGTLALRSINQQPVPYRTIKLSGAIESRLVAGENVLAAEVHQYRVGSGDMVFDLGLSAVVKGTTGQTIFEEGSPWKYRDNPAPPDEDWTEADFDDGDWREGAGILGYGDNDIATKLRSGPDPKDKPITVWLRKSFTIDSILVPGSLRLRFLRDDGVVIYLNGSELLRDNMPPGFIDTKTTSVTTVSGGSERKRREFLLGAEGLVHGKNVMAVEVHQRSSDSSDLAFDMALEISFLPPGKGGRIPPPVKKRRLIDLADAKAVEEARQADWQFTAKQLLEAALKAHGAGKLQDAVRGYYASRWANVFATRGFETDPALKAFFLAGTQSATSQEFFDLLSSFDQPADVYRLMNRTFKESPSNFKKHPKLALAIALVYDQGPPRSWPHYQVSANILPRTLPDPVEALNFWASAEKAGKTLHSLDSLSIEELKYVVDTPVPLAELQAAQKERVKLSNLDSLYSGINYVHERVQNNIYNWPHQSYTLPDIKRHGGICVDQAYYASQIAKAHGVPSMVVSGAGQNGNHAWIGYLDRRGRWNFEVGRYPESKFVTGVTHDPQTWQQPTDHDIAILTERFRNTSSYRVSRIHSLFAEEYFRRGDHAASIKAAEAALASEARNLAAWETLIKAKKVGKAPAAELDELYQRGAKAFARYADLEASFLRRLSASLEEQGKAEDAEKLRRKIIARNRRERPDLALEEAGKDLEEAMKDQSPDEQLALYKKQVLRFREAGLIAYYAITQPFLGHLSREGKDDLAREALEYTMRRMDAEEGSQLEEEFAEWSKELGAE